MFFDMLIEIEDRSFYTDKLEELTGIPRRDWLRLTLVDLREHYVRVMKRDAQKRARRERALIS